MEKLNERAKKHFPDMRDASIESVPLEGGMYVYGFATDLDDDEFGDAEIAILKEINELYPKLIILTIG